MCLPQALFHVKTFIYPPPLAHGSKSCPPARVPLAFLSINITPYDKVSQFTPEERRSGLPSFFRFFWLKHHDTNFTGRVSPGILFCLKTLSHFTLSVYSNPSLARRRRIVTLTIRIFRGEFGNMKGRVPMRGFSLMPEGPGKLIDVRRGTGRAFGMVEDFSLYLCGPFFKPCALRQTPNAMRCALCAMR